MFLLIPDEWIPVIMAVIFTFHDVSINTKDRMRFELGDVTLHSTMFLLIQLREVKNRRNKHPLHSTMFLLIRIQIQGNIDSLDPLHSTMFLLIL